MRSLLPEGRHVVVTVANAGGYSSVAARRAGLEVRYCDVDPLTHCIDPAALERVMDQHVGVIVATHLYGRLADTEAVNTIARQWGAAVLEDCAQSVGAQREEQAPRLVGDAAAFSFYPTKNLGALGDGGAVASNDQEVLARVRELRQYGWSSKYRIAVDGGRNSRLDELQAAVLRFRLPRLSAWNARRREIISEYQEAASRRVRVLQATGPSHAAHLAVVESADVNALRVHLRSRLVGFDVHYPVPDHHQAAFAEGGGVCLPVTESLTGRVLTLPCFPELRSDEIERICDALHSF
jgi:dTDP-4-amino-4,6-dideoxygalactose transaminase